MNIRKAYKFRLYPNAAQRQALAVQFGHSRFIYNWGLAQSQEKYPGYKQLANQLPALKMSEETAWLAEADAQVLQQKLRDLDRAFRNFFEGRAKYPRFHSRRHRQSIRYPQRVKADPEARRSYLPKVGWVRTVFHRPLEGKIKNVTVSRTKSGRYFASFQVELEITDPQYKGKAVGIDLGLASFLALSDGKKVANPRHLLQSEKKLRRMQRSISRRQKGSAGWEKQRQKVARQHEKVANQRQDFQHKLSRRLVEENRLIGIEDLHIKGMLRNRRLAKHISDAGWGQFVRMLEYKGEWYGCEIVPADRRYPSSKTCSTCGAARKDLQLSDRKWQCDICGSIHDRDVNAAINLLNNTTVGTAESHAWEQHVRPERSGQRWLNQEANLL